ncbi:histidine phosphatase family protein [Pontibacter qinzhouensis]|uniref:Histidine phosphatase family protein n=2 Tax=Pontibacter qinzhouensis TaxID=2603253 RepID=A0A5C8K805_9BACT|nr:histidine phosphatase family protein [Pontibacter qinzhouensis]
MVEKRGLYNFRAASQFISDYDAAHVEEFVFEHHALPAGAYKKIFCSTLIRSQLTAKAIFGDEAALVVMPEFREFERKVFALPWLRLPVTFWLAVARVLWFMGFNSRGIETFKQARKRAKQCATVLAQEAEENKAAIVVAHGLLNNFIMRELRRMGWRLQEKGGSGFLAVNIMER